MLHMNGRLILPAKSHHGTDYENRAHHSASLPHSRPVIQKADNCHIEGYSLNQLGQSEFVTQTLPSMTGVNKVISQIAKAIQKNSTAAITSLIKNITYLRDCYSSILNHFIIRPQDLHIVGSYAMNHTFTHLQR